jgi:glucokinase
VTHPGSQSIVLAGDIPVPEVIEIYPSKEAPNLASIVEKFLGIHQVSISSACFGVAGPVKNGRCKTTNLPWDVSETKLKNRFGWDKVRLINDLTATSYAIPLLTGRELFSLNRGKKSKGGSIGLIAPGTGLGMALMVWKDGNYVSMPSEGGHSDLAPQNETEVALWKYLHVRLGHVSVERVLSGPGLFITYCWLKFTGQGSEPAWLAQRMNEDDPSKVISELALVEKEPLCVKTLDLFVSILGATAGNLALTGLTMGGIYIGGGIAPKILPKLGEALFIKAFVDKGRFTGLLQSIPVRVILNDKAALLGAAHCALEMER